MPQVIAFEDVKAHQFRGKNHSLTTPFLKSSSDTPHLPVAFLSQSDPGGRVIKPHYHLVDEFQIVAEGKGKLGRHDIAPYHVHFARAYTPYGPLMSDCKATLSFFTLRAHSDPGVFYIPESKDKLKQTPDRQPWQITRQVEFPAEANGVNLQEIPDMKDAQGLFAYSLTMAPNTKISTPDVMAGDGQYTVVVKGGLWHDNKEHKAFTVVFVKPGEGPFVLQAGLEGLQAIIMNFPRARAPAAVKAALSATVGLKKWQCELCAFAYDEALGLPHDGIAPGTRWEDIPESWVCPDCAASKSDFQRV